MVGEPVALLDDAEALRAFRPEWCLFWAGSVQPSQFEIWRPYLQRSRHRYLVLARSGSVPGVVRDTIASMPNVRAMEATDESVRWLKKAPGFRGFLYVLGFKPATFTNVNTFRDEAHVWIAHGESQKRSSGPRSASIYDAILISRYAKIDGFPRAIRPWLRRTACAIGAPIVDGVAADPWREPRPIRTLLYAPTWEGYSEHTDYSTLPTVGPVLAAEMAALRQRGVRVLVAPHPRTGARRPDHPAALEALVEAGAERVVDKVAAFRESDLVVTDISGVNAEYLFTRKPVLMAPPAALASLGRSWESLAADHPWAYRWDPATEPILERLAALERADPLRARRERSADEMYRGHTSLDEAARTFDLALWAVGVRKTPISVRRAFELARRFPSLPQQARRLRPVARRVPGLRRLT